MKRSVLVLFLQLFCIVLLAADESSLSSRKAFVHHKTFRKLLQFGDIDTSPFVRNNIRFMEALVFYQTARYKRASLLFRNLKETYRSRSIGKVAAFLYADCLRNLQQSHAALLAYQQFSRLYPAHPFADDALYWTGMVFLGSGHYKSASACFKRIISSYHGRNCVEAAKARLVQLQYMKKVAQRVIFKKDNVTDSKKDNTKSSYIKWTKIDTGSKQNWKKGKKELARMRAQLEKRKVQLAKEALRLKHLATLLKVKEKNLAALHKALQKKEAALKRKEKELKSFEYK